MWLTMISGSEVGKSLRASGERFLIGRGDDCDLVVADEKVSRHHAVLRVLDERRATLQDLGSTNGTHVDGRRIETPRLLTGNEQLQFGDTLFLVSTAVPVNGSGPVPDGPATVLGTALAGSAAPHAKPPWGAAPARTGAGPAVGAPGAAPGPRQPPANGGASVGAPPAFVRTPGPDTIERRALRQSLSRTRLVAIAALAVAVLIAALFGVSALPSQNDPLTVAEIVEAATPSTVLVLTSVAGEVVGAGTGWVLDAQQGLIVTNHHVVNGGEALQVGVGRQAQRRAAQLVATAPCEDLAVLKVDDPSGLRTMPLGAQADLRRGDLLVAIGFPVSLSEREDLTATTGIVSVPQTVVVGGGPSPDLPNVVQTDAAVNPGNSGGPLVNDEGQLVGVNTLGLAQGQNTNYAIGVDQVKAVTSDLLVNGSKGFAGLGWIVPEDPQEMARLGIAPEAGLLLTTAVPGSAAAQAGLGQAPRLLVAIDGQRLDNGVASYCAAAGQRRRGERATFRVATPQGRNPQDVPIEFL